jgi:hypothetical protein
MAQDRRPGRYRDKTVDARPPSLRDFGHIGLCRRSRGGFGGVLFFLFFY